VWSNASWQQWICVAKIEVGLLQEQYNNVLVLINDLCRESSHMVLLRRHRKSLMELKMKNKTKKERKYLKI
jgi:hypothetical protein